MKLDYKICKELKDAGFRLPPSTDRDGYTLTMDGNVRNDRYIYKTESWEWKGEHYFIPTLSELIEACGDEFEDLKKGYNNWVATGLSDDAERFIKTGKTPEEAVAKLYIALNKK